MMIDKEKYLQIRKELDQKGVSLVAVSKQQPAEKIVEMYELGQKTFGENRATSLKDRHKELPADIVWHMIGHLQTNKIKYIAPFVSMIHSIDSMKLLQMIDKEAYKCNRVINCLLQVFIAQEETKFGFEEEEIKKMLDQKEITELTNTRICGLMGMATLTEDEMQIGKEFRGLSKLFDELKNNYIIDPANFNILSMGMSDDYKIAVEEGSNMVRIGTLIFGERENRI